MPDAVIIEAVRSPIGRRNGGLSTVHPADLLSTVLGELVTRTGIDPTEIGQIVGGCVSQVGEQSFNITRTACCPPACPRRSQRPRSTRSADRRSRRSTSPPPSSPSGVTDVAIACGVESMSRIPIG